MKARFRHTIVASKIWIFGLLSTIVYQSCIKNNTIGKDNDNVVLTPHTVYAASDKGWIVNANDGRTFSSIFPPDGYPISMISSAQKNILIRKSRLFYSNNNGTNFNPVSFLDYNPKSWSSWVMDCISHNRTYVTTSLFKGVAYSEDGGINWKIDSVFEDAIMEGENPSSFAQMGESSQIFAYCDDRNTLYTRNGSAAKWSIVNIKKAPPQSVFYLTSNPNELYLIDYSGANGVWISKDKGINWEKLEDGVLPIAGTDKHVCGASTSPGVIAVATETDVYFNEGNKGFVKANTGLKAGTKIYGMTTEYTVYKNGNKNHFLYMSTSKGIYRSDDKGFTWDKITFNEYDTEYRAIF